MSRPYRKRKPATARKPKRAYRNPIPRGAQHVPSPQQPDIPTARPRRTVGGVLKGIGNGLLDFGLGKLSKMAKNVISGMGDYDIAGVNHNSLISKMSPVVPEFDTNASSGSIRICHREYIQDILSSTTFNNQVFPINVALIQTFPWLSRIGAQFEQYRINGMIFEFKSGSSDALNSTNTALGYVIGAVEYNALASPFTDKLSMENAIFASSTKPSLSMITAVECAPGQTSIPLLYTRLGYESLTSSDLRLYDLGTFNIATVGMQQEGVNLGELWVSYDVSLYKTRFSKPGENIPVMSGQFINMYAEENLLGKYESKINTLGVILEQSPYSTSPTSMSVCTFTLPPQRAGTYILNYEVLGVPDSKDSTFPFNRPPFADFVNIEEVLLYPSTGGTSGTFNFESYSWNMQNTITLQTPTSHSQFLTFCFRVLDNSVSSSFTMSADKDTLNKLITEGTGEIQSMGRFYITQTSPQI